MSDSWFASKIAPNGDTNDNEGGCDPKEARALKTYLRHKITVSEAARAITRPVSNAANPKDELHHLWGLIQDAFRELPHEHTAPLIELMQAIEGLPNPAAIPNESEHPDDGFWKDSPGFGNLWADMYPRYCFRANVDGSAGDLREVMRIDHARQAHIEAQLVHVGLAGLRYIGATRSLLMRWRAAKRFSTLRFRRWLSGWWFAESGFWRVRGIWS